MCGITGLIYKNKQVNKQAFIAMRDTLAHRGPDDVGVEYFDNDRMALGHRRLSFLDLSPAGHQPLCNEDGSVWIVFNGEIYNYLELRKELVEAGHTFKTHTDTEVIIHGYEQWGEDVVNHLTGIFAFGLLDLNKRRLFLARDRFGVKPLYYCQADGHFLFASEVKAIVASPDVKKEIDISSMADYLVYRYVPSPKTIWKGVNKLPPAHYMVFDYATWTATTTEYWQLHFGEEKPDEAELVHDVDLLLGRSVAINGRSDVPVGAFLSGGYDSSAVTYYMVKAGYRPETFAIGFEGWGESEHQYAEMVANYLNVPFNYSIADDKTLDLLQIMPEVFDEPLSDISIVPTWMVSHEAVKKVKAVMSGDGGDELFGGYTWQKRFYDLQRPASIMGKIQAMLGRNGKSMDAATFYAGPSSMAMGRFDNPELKKAFEPKYHRQLPEDSDWFYKKHFNTSLSPLKAIQLMDIKCFMGELVLTKVDRASMANSLEVRVPFLDHQLFERVFRSREDIYYKPGVTKFLLRECIKQHLPKTILERSKQGFVGPDDFYKNMERYRGILNKSRLVEDGIIRKAYIDGILATNDHWRCWKLIVLENWYERWVS